MKYTPRAFQGNVNVSRRSPLADFLILSAGLGFALFMVYFALGLAAETLATRISPRLENKIGTIFSPGGKKGFAPLKDSTIIRLFDSLKTRMPQGLSNYTIQVSNQSIVNAVALPGGHIVVFQGLLDTVKSEGELAFVLAHELGHFYNRDHLRGLGRSLSLMVISTLVLGGDNALNEMFVSSILTAESRFSQNQERAADLFAVDLVYQTFGTVTGITDFFTRFDKEHEVSTFRYFFSTHSSPQDRSRAINEKIAKMGYGQGGVFF